MTPQNAKLPGSNSVEIDELLDVLSKAGRRLEELTSGQVDTATDAEGRMLLLRGTREQLKRNEVARQAAILNALPANIALLNPNGVLISVNDSWKRFALENTMDCGIGEGLGLNYLEICDKAAGPGMQDAHLAASGIRSVLSGQAESFVLDYQCSSRVERRWFKLIVTPLSHADPGSAIIMHRNITSTKENEAKLLLLAERLSLATEVAKIGVWEWDLASNDLTWDATMFAIYGLPKVPTMPYGDWAATVLAEDLGRVEAALNRSINERHEETAEFRIIAADGSLKYISAAQRVTVDEDGIVCKVVGVNVDVTERKKADEDLRRNQMQITHLAEHDFLTDLPNQMVLHDRIDQAIKSAARNKKKVALLFLDMDGFKHINDSLGHPVGDKLLKSVANRLVECARASDTVSRLGGDEFIILLPDVDHPEGTATAARRLLAAIGAIHSIGQHELHIGASIGVSVFPEDGTDGDTLIKNADTAMFQAKSKGNSSFQFFHADMNIKAVERQFIEQNLRRALERNELSLQYQPKIDLKSRAIIGSEALLRWTHPIRGQIPPSQFISVAEDSGLILSIGTWVLQEACRQACEWQSAGLNFGSMAVNVSGKQFQSDRFAETLTTILLNTGMDPKHLELEVTESLLMKNPLLAASLLQNLRGKGVSIAIDDFGTGYSSLSYLQRFPIDTLKIDQSFVRQINTPEGVSIVTAIIQMGRSLGMKIIAEGVENEYEATILEDMGCKEAQGYYYFRPMDPGQVATLLELQVDAGAFLPEGLTNPNELEPPMVI